MCTYWGLNHWAYRSICDGTVHISKSCVGDEVAPEKAEETVEKTTETHSEVNDPVSVKNDVAPPAEDVPLAEHTPAAEVAAETVAEVPSQQSEAKEKVEQPSDADVASAQRVPEQASGTVQVA